VALGRTINLPGLPYPRRSAAKADKRSGQPCSGEYRRGDYRLRDYPGGTFATLITAPLQVVLQIGVAIASGVLIDTFVVRALLVPSCDAGGTLEAGGRPVCSRNRGK